MGPMFLARNLLPGVGGGYLVRFKHNSAQNQKPSAHQAKHRGEYAGGIFLWEFWAGKKMI